MFWSRYRVSLALHSRLDLLSCFFLYPVEKVEVEWECMIYLLLKTWTRGHIGIVVGCPVLIDNRN